MSKADKTEVAGAVSGAAVGTAGGIASSVAAISTAGSVSGLGAAGITSGLATIGGSMLGGVAVLSGGTVLLAGAFGYGGYKLAKWFKK